MTMEPASASTVPSRRDRVREVAQRVGLAAQAAIAAIGAFGLWTERAEGRAVSRPSAIAFWAGVAGLAVTLVAPRIRAYVRSRRRDA